MAHTSQECSLSSVDVHFPNIVIHMHVIRLNVALSHPHLTTASPVKEIASLVNRPLHASAPHSQHCGDARPQAAFKAALEVLFRLLFPLYCSLLVNTRAIRQTRFAMIPIKLTPSASPFHALPSP